MAKRLTREEVPVEEAWRLEDLFPTIKDWEGALGVVDSEIAHVTCYRGRLKEGPGTLLQCLEAAEDLLRKFFNVNTYATLRLSGDGTNPANQAIAGRAAAAMARVQAGLSFIEPEILALPDGTIAQYLTAEPGLRPFKRNLKQILSNKPYVLSPEAEKVLASLGEVMKAPHMLYNRTKSSDMRFEPVTDSTGRKVPVSFATYEVMLEKSPDVTLRRNAFLSFTRGISAYQNVLGGTFGTEIRKNVVLAKTRGFESTTHMFLHYQESSMKAYTNLLDIIQKEIAPHMRRSLNSARECSDWIRSCTAILKLRWIRNSTLSLLLKRPGSRLLKLPGSWGKSTPVLSALHYATDGSTASITSASLQVLSAQVYMMYTPISSPHGVTVLAQCSRSHTNWATQWQGY